MPPDEHLRESTPRPWQPRFGLGSMLLAMTVCSVMAAAGYYLVRSLQGGRQFQLAFILFTLATPVLLVVIVSTTLAVLRWLQGGARPRRRT